MFDGSINHIEKNTINCDKYQCLFYSNNWGHFFINLTIIIMID